ncbi:putative nuclear pore complex subunit Nup133 [Aspergillus alliaceus]|uniref:putative nuclear pore complex subunit Nup133 n=1 Tax=Petromyces alliaceus TaxID=209559 RepID=UPI0012A3FF8B|nr:Non-repetitive/WGA-negative nucleoporin C-terminal-domain-containing protein [Aspergillus alliaceus]KAB8228530.1 Non-repetitive/WGA-negative nucleoporin C-terminal-domain-containing protein [Aspergillus alliaceus]
MFVPKAAISSAASLRNPRRRQRTSSDESVNPPKAKRQRSSLRHDDSEFNSDNQGELHEPWDRRTSIASEELGRKMVDSPTFQENMPIRGLKKPERRGESDGTIVLSQTDFYNVLQLPTLPDQIRGLQSGSFRCFFGSSNGYAVAMTYSHAIIWPYSTAASSPSPTDVFSLPIPESCREPNGPVPLGIILSTVAAGVPGLMVITPNTGKIVYWETVSSAAALGLARQKHKAIQGCIPNLLSGEHVTDLVNGEPAGVIVTLSSGRVAHITVRDPQGKPAVTVNFLRNTSGLGRMGFFGGIRNVLGGGFSRKDLAAVRAGDSHQRGQRDIIIATSGGLFEIWDTHWNNGSILKKQYDITNDLCDFFGTEYSNGSDNSAIKILDFSLLPVESNDRDLRANGPEPSWHISLLVAPYGIISQSVCLVQIDLAEKVLILSSHSIELHEVPAGLGSKPKLFLPKPGDTAFIVMDHSVVLLSSISSKDQSTQHGQPQLLQDTINFRSGKAYEILGCGMEDNTDDYSCSTCLIMVRDFGIIRITALPRQNPYSVSEEVRITAKHKIEQAIFYGTMLGNPLNLTNKGSLDFPVKDIEQAALDICQELLKSTSRFIPTTGISLEQNLRSRAKALDDLAYLLVQQNKSLSQQTWWELLWGAEKLAAQRAMWKIEENSRKIKGKGPTFLAHVIDSMSDKFKTQVAKQEGEIDFVRNWFLYDTFRMGHIVPWIYNTIKPQKGHSSRQGRKISEQILEASELSLAVLETAFRYRDEHSSQYGICDGYLEDGVLVTGFKDLPEFWTSQSFSYVEMGHLLDLELDSCRAWIQQTISVTEAPESLIVKRIAGNSARQLYVLGQMHRERVRWLSAQDDPKLVDESIANEQAHAKQRKWQLFKLAGIGRLEDAITLAESFRDMSALVELIIELQDQTKCEIFPQNSLHGSSDTTSYESDHLNRKISHYFDKFGESWADAFFSRQISMHQSGILFAMRKFQPFITQFLRRDAAYSRLGWINDVIGENDYNAAAQSLEKLAIGGESDLWSHRVELSLAKLAKLATWEGANTPSHSALHSDIRHLEDLSEIDAVQEVIYACISPALQGAIDQKAEIDLAIEHFGKLIAEDRPSLRELLSETLARVVTRQVIDVNQLVDLLTLMDATQAPEYSQSELSGKEFYLALRVICLGACAQQDSIDHVALQKLVWRRCMIKDNWVAIGKASENVENVREPYLYDTALFRTLGLCLRDRLNEDASYTSLYIPSSPDDVLLTGSDSELLSARFRLEQRSRIVHDLERENDTLCEHVEKGNLDFWFKNLLASAEESASSTVPGITCEESSHDNQVGELSPQQKESNKARLSWL